MPDDTLRANRLIRQQEALASVRSVFESNWREIRNLILSVATACRRYSRRRFGRLRPIHLCFLPDHWSNPPVFAFGRVDLPA